MGHARRRPNILFIQAESFDGRLLGYLGHPAMRQATSHLDELAAQGVCFENMYSNCPLCCPSRASMWSGRFAHALAAWNNSKGLEPDEPTFATHLEAAGYDSCMLGKTDYLSRSHSGAARIGAWTRAASIPRPIHGEKTPPQILPDYRGRARAGDWDKADRACAFLHEQAACAKPFFLYIGLGLAHHAFSTSQHYLEKIPEECVFLPPKDALRHPALPLQRLQKNWSHALDCAGMRLRRRIYFAMIAEIDAIVGMLLHALDTNGLRDDTWVIFTSDHGEMAGTHGQYIKLTHFESSARVPLLIRGPDAKRGGRISQPTSLIDLHPTVLEIAGARKPVQLNGHSLMPELAGDDTARPGRVFAEHHSTSCPTGAFMLRRDQWKYITYPGYPPLLFNLAQDPEEQNDLAAGAPERVRKLDAELRGIVDYESVDARAKAEDRECFAAWREQALAAGTYEQQMAATYSGADHPPRPVSPWRDEDEARIEQWLAGETPSLPSLDQIGTSQDLPS